MTAQPNPSVCGRLLVGRGPDTWDPLCVRPPGHDGICRPEIVHITRSGGEVVILEWLEQEHVRVRYVETGAIRVIPRSSL